MKPSHSLAMMVLAAAVLASSQPVAAAPSLSTVLTQIYQVGNGPNVSLGHAVIASTLYNRIIAGGTFVAACNRPEISPASGQRTLTRETLAGGASLVVTIPATVPAVMAMPGFDQLPRGTTVNCTYTWTSRAVESGFSVGAGGINYQTGNGERADGSFKTFTMSVPGNTDTSDIQSCVP